MPCLQTASDGRRCASRPPSGTLHIQRGRFYQLPFRGGHSHWRQILLAHAASLHGHPPVSLSVYDSWSGAPLAWESTWSLEEFPSFGVCVCVCSYVWLFVTSWVVNPPGSSPSMEFSRQEYCNELPFPTPGNLPNPGIEPTSPALAGRFFSPSLGGLCQSHCHVEKGVVSCWPSL